MAKVQRDRGIHMRTTHAWTSDMDNTQTSTSNTGLTPQSTGTNQKTLQVGQLVKHRMEMTTRTNMEANKVQKV